MSGITNDLARKIFNHKESNARRRIATRGRQALWMVYENFSTDPKAGVLYDMEDLMNARLVGENLEAFMTTWDNVVIHLSKPPDETILEALFCKQVKECQKMKSYWDAYSFANIGDKTHTYDYLYQSAKGIIDRGRKLRARNRLVGGSRGNNAFIVNGDNKAVTDKGKERGRASKPIPTSDVLCYFFQQGHCVHGKDCKYSHNTANYKIKAKRPGSYRPPSRSGTPSGRKNV